VATIYVSRHVKHLEIAVPEGHKGWQINHVLATPPLPSLTSATHFVRMEQQGTIKSSQSAPPNLGSLRPIVAQQTARYDIVNKYVGSIVNPFKKH
jgi:hypothetical protein